jgi:hypothetical protein
VNGPFGAFNHIARIVGIPLAYLQESQSFAPRFGRRSSSERVGFSCQDNRLRPPDGNKAITFTDAVLSI